MRDFKINDLFRPGANINLNACVGSNGGPYDFYDYALGYLRSCKAIARAARNREIAVDIAVYPLVYNLRHGVELALKHFAQTLPLLFGEVGEVAATHKLKDNWAKVRAYVVREPYLDPTATVPPFDTLIEALVQFDPSGEVFRFPESRKGDLHLQDARIINLDVVEEGAEQAEGLVEFWQDQLTIMQDRRRLEPTAEA